MSDTTDPTVPVATPTAEEKQWAMFAHLSTLAGAILTGWAFGIGFFIGPLIIWLVKKDTMPFVNDQGKEALNFAITVCGISFILILLTFMSFGIGALVTFPLMMIVGIGSLVFVILAAVKSHEGTAYRYPVSLRLVK